MANDKGNTTQSPQTLFDRDGDYLVQQDDITNRIPMSAELKQRLSRDAKNLPIGSVFINSGGFAMLPLSHYYRHELKPAMETAFKKAMLDYCDPEADRIDVDWIVDMCIKSLENVMANIDETRS